jgi:ACS family hexuronate transporter-like MFS transporter
MATVTQLAQQAPVHPSPIAKIGNYRWKICGLLFYATTINYMDRQVLALLKPTLQSSTAGIGLTEVQYAAIVSIFSAAYAIGLLLAGNFIDRVGTRTGYAAVLGLWSVAAASHTLVKFTAVTSSLHAVFQAIAHALSFIPIFRGTGWLNDMGNLSGAVIGFGVARFVLGLGEAGNFPAAIKTVAEWFPSKERAFATGIFNSGCNIGATVAPFLVGFIVYRFGWQYAFLATSALSLTWLALWLASYRAPQDEPRLSAAELAYIQSDPAPPGTGARVSWASLLRHRQTWAFLAGKVMTDPIWWFYLYWLPGFLNTRYGLSITGMGLPLLVIYNVSTVGSVFGGWLPARFIDLGWTLNRARKTAMLLYAIAVVPIVFAGNVHSVWSAVALISLATAAHQAWSANLFTLVSDMFPRHAVASVVGIGASGGSTAMMFFGLFIGFILQTAHGNYVPVFLIAGSSYLLAIGSIQLLAPRLERANV